MSPFIQRGVFVTGTDTGVGKTFVAVELARLLTLRGVRVRARKPVESGCLPPARVPRDADALRVASGAREPLGQICSYALEAPVAPDRAAAREGRRLRRADLERACHAGASAGDFLLVEGAGGFCSPIAEDALNADLSVALGLPVLLVTEDRLGAIHQVLVCAEAIERRGLSLAAVVLNRPCAGAPDANLDNAADLARRLGEAPYVFPHRVGHAAPGAAASPLTGLERRLGIAVPIGRTVVDAR